MWRVRRVGLVRAVKLIRRAYSEGTYGFECSESGICTGGKATGRTKTADNNTHVHAETYRLVIRNSTKKLDTIPEDCIDPYNCMHWGQCKGMCKGDTNELL